MLLHVDDMLVCGKKDYVLNKFVSTLQKRYKISASYLQDVGDELTFFEKNSSVAGRWKAGYCTSS